MSQTIHQVDAFTREAFKGNPAAVCILEATKPEAWMRAVASEMNLSETAFLLREGEDWRLRWFTPVVEIDLCGHATLSSAHVLFETGLALANGEIGFQTRSGRLTARRRNERIELDFPATPPRPVMPPAGLLDALGLERASFSGKSRMDYFVRVDDERAVRELAPDFTRLAALEVRGVIVTAASAGAQDFISRFFAPGSGVNEDPVTGSAHCALGPYWSAELGKPVLVGYQASPRGGFVEVEPRGERVLLRGEAVTVLRCELLVE